MTSQMKEAVQALPQLGPKALAVLLKKMLDAKQNMMIVGSPGIGKSDIVAQVCKDLGYDVIIDHPVVSDPVDYKGFPYVDPVTGRATFLPYGNLERAMSATKPTVYFLDDVGQAPPSVQAALMQLVLARRINGHKVSDHVVFIAATNKTTDRAGVSGILEPLKSRFTTIIELLVNNDDWIEWANRQGFHPAIPAFIRYRPNMLHDFSPTNTMAQSVSPRTVAHANTILQMNLPREVEIETLAGAAGKGWAVEFLGFMAIFDKLVDVDVILRDPEGAPVPEDPAALFGIAALLASKATKKNIKPILQYVDRLPISYRILLARDIHQRDAALSKTNDFIMWLTKYDEVML